jgi:hypothetical protein
MDLNINWRVGIALILALLFVQGVGHGFIPTLDSVGDAIMSVGTHKGD